MIRFFHNNSRVIFKSLESGQNLAGFNSALVWADEIDKVSLDTWNEVLNRGRAVEGGIAFGTCNPGNQSHWLYEHYFKYLDENGVSKQGTNCVYLTMYDNKFLPKSYIEMQERKYGYSALERSRAIEGKFVSMQGLVYSMWSRKFVIDRNKIDIGPQWPCWASVDFGFEHPSAYYRIAKRAEDNKYIIFFEHYQKGFSPKQNAEVMKRRIGFTPIPMKTFSDHYSETVATYRENGIHLTLANKSKGSLMNGVKLIQELLLEERLLVCDNCPNLIR